MIRKGIGSGKLILFGEYAAIYGFPAIGTSLPFQTELYWIPSQTTSIERDKNKDDQPCVAVGTPNEIGEDRAGFLKLLKKLQSEIAGPDDFGNGTWREINGVPRTGGFGSSAALCVAISRIALNRAAQIYDVQVHSLANRLETLFHGKTSGIDTGMACDNGASAWFSSLQGPPKRRIIRIPKWHIIYGAVPRNRSTESSIRQLEHKTEKTHFMSSMRKLGRIAVDFLSIMEGNSPEVFANAASRLVNHAQEILATLNLSNPILDKIFELAIRCGANGGKLSGGGSGGAFFICAKNKKTRNEVLTNLPRYLTEENIHLSFPLKALDFNNHSHGARHPSV